MADHRWSARRVYGFVCKAEVYGTTEQEDPGVIQMRMTFHFARVADSDITVDGATPGECYQKAYDERMKQVTPTKVQGEVTEDKSLVSPLGVGVGGKLNV